MGNDQHIIDEIVRRVLRATTPDCIILFGSAATGKMTKDSDMDLLIHTGEQPRDRSERLCITRALRELQFPFDVVLIAAERFEESKNVVGGIAYPTNKFGKMSYEAA